ncbi:MAG: alkaline phosphatase [Phycisphaerae bacterium]|jgi:alkaline phosphatase
MITKIRSYSFVFIFVFQSLVFAAAVPQNIIFMIIDGCGFNRIAAADYYEYGKKGGQVYEKFPVKLAVSTYPAGGSYNSQRAQNDFDYVEEGCTDSAAAATALATGVKTSNGSIGVDVNEKPLGNIIEKCEKLGMATGVITTVPFSHATPAGFVAHQKSRGSYTQIADEMITHSELEVIFGCGNPYYNNDGKKIDDSNFKYISSELWQKLAAGSAGMNLIQSRQDFLNLADGGTPQRVIGIAQVFETLQVNRSGISKAPFDVPFNQNVPTLAEMSNAALNVLDDDNDGFFVMIEGGAVDWASHRKNSPRMIEEMIDFENAVKAIVKWVETKSSWKKTLVIITADHETGYLTVTASGKKIPLMEWHCGGHTNSLVRFFAKGAGAKSFIARAQNTDPVHGKYIDNTDIPKTIFKFLETRKSQTK